MRWLGVERWSTVRVPGLVGFFSAFFLVVAPAYGSFDGSSVTAQWEMWSGSSPGAGGSLLAVIDTEAVVASDLTSPDISDFNDTSGTTNELWDIDFQGNTLTLTYTSIEYQDFDHQYMYMMPVGFHFSLSGAPALTDVTVDTTYAPHGFDPLKVDFTGTELWVNLQGSMCHYPEMGGGMMGGMPSCENGASPTGYDNQIVLTVSTVPEPSTAILFGMGLSGLTYWRSRSRRG